MRSDWSLEEVMNSRYKDYQAVSAEHDANYHTWMMKVELPPLSKFTQDGEFDYPYYRVYTYYCEYCGARIKLGAEHECDQLYEEERDDEAKGD